jgi:hypothetical protein
MEQNDHHLLPSRRRILQISIGALLVATFIAIGFVLPAEYGVDLFGVGSYLKIKNLSSGRADMNIVAHVPASETYKQDSAMITLRFRKGVEYKYRIAEGNMMLYSWKADKPVSFDFHGEPGDASLGKFRTHATGTTDQANGSFAAPFTGTHGWYWENETAESITITLETAGFYEVIGDPKKHKQANQ